MGTHLKWLDIRSRHDVSRGRFLEMAGMLVGNGTEDTLHNVFSGKRSISLRYFFPKKPYATAPKPEIWSFTDWNVDTTAVSLREYSNDADLWSNVRRFMYSNHPYTHITDLDVYTFADRLQRASSLFMSSETFKRVVIESSEQRADIMREIIGNYGSALYHHIHTGIRISIPFIGSDGTHNGWYACFNNKETSQIKIENPYFTHCDILKALTYREVMADSKYADYVNSNIKFMYGDESLLDLSSRRPTTRSIDFDCCTEMGLW